MSLENPLPSCSNRKCYVCLALNPKYTCPRCNVVYCSLACYKDEKHEQCSESFYKECFVNDLKQRSVPEHEKVKVFEMLERVEEENPVDEFCDGGGMGRSLEDRLQGLDINNLKDEQVDDLWERLSPGEKEEFKRCASSGNFLGEDVAKPWQPWWLQHSPELVVEIGDDKNDSTSKIEIVQVSPIKTLLPAGKLSSPFVAFNLTNCLYPYLFFQRLYNGCGVSDFCEEFSESCVQSSEFLENGKTFESMEEALINAQDRCVKNSNSLDIEVSEEFVSKCIQDVSHVFVGPDVERCNEYAMMALSELHSACMHCRKILKSKQKSGDTETGSSFRKHLFGVIKKLEFLLAWCLEYPSQFPVLSLELTEIYKIRKQEEMSNSQLKDSVDELRSKVKNKTLSQPLIVEIN